MTEHRPLSSQLLEQHQRLLQEADAVKPREPASQVKEMTATRRATFAGGKGGGSPLTMSMSMLPPHLTNFDFDKTRHFREHSTATTTTVSTSHQENPVELILKSNFVHFHMDVNNVRSPRVERTNAETHPSISVDSLDPPKQKHHLARPRSVSNSENQTGSRSTADVDAAIIEKYLECSKDPGLFLSRVMQVLEKNNYLTGTIFQVHPQAVQIEWVHLGDHKPVSQPAEEDLVQNMMDSNIPLSRASTQNWTLPPHFAHTLIPSSPKGSEPPEDVAQFYRQELESIESQPSTSSFPSTSSKSKSLRNTQDSTTFTSYSRPTTAWGGSTIIVPHASSPGITSTGGKKAIMGGGFRSTTTSNAKVGSPKSPKNKEQTEWPDDTHTRDYRYVL
ncbi:hypothetical protein PROFUN_05161 [Planoprotostelium fungivorum]|uniref:Uncharacterized protein n=1 Tax=Planoprotostelium fungivorum TaxID=1890364 RepID=A0A2P6NRS3_9EUKA|nr:hypothetical protein PROFUN_05161 [Planoprotostelium fungivorum]